MPNFILSWLHPSFSDTLAQTLGAAVLVLIGRRRAAAAAKAAGDTAPLAKGKAAVTGAAGAGVWWAIAATVFVLTAMAPTAPGLLAVALGAAAFFWGGEAHAEAVPQDGHWLGLPPFPREGMTRRVALLALVAGVFAIYQPGATLIAAVIWVVLAVRGMWLAPEAGRWAALAVVAALLAPLGRGFGPASIGGPLIVLALVWTAVRAQVAVVRADVRASREALHMIAQPLAALLGCSAEAILRGQVGVAAKPAWIGVAPLPPAAVSRVANGTLQQQVGLLMPDWSIETVDTRHLVLVPVTDEDRAARAISAASGGLVAAVGDPAGGPTQGAPVLPPAGGTVVADSWE